MSFPFIDIAATTVPSTTQNLTTLTGGSQATGNVLGFNDADWYIDQFRRKFDGGRQLVPSYFGSVSGFSNASYPGSPAIQFSDSSDDDAAGVSTMSGLITAPNYAAGTINVGVSYAAFANRRLHEIYWFGWLDGTPYQATGTISDGSSSVFTYSVPSSGAIIGIRARYRARVDGSTFTFKIAKTGGSGVYMVPLWVYKPPSVATWPWGNF